MLKYIAYGIGFFFAVGTLSVAAYAPPAYATSASLVIVQIQAGGVGAATQEFVSIYNNSDDDAALSGWCIANKSTEPFACFAPQITDQQQYLPAHSYATIGSSAFTAYTGIGLTLTYDPINQSSGSITGSSDTITLLDASGAAVDQHSWTTSLAGGMVLSRRFDQLDAQRYQDTNLASDWEVKGQQFIPDDQTLYRSVEVVDMCQNIDGIQVVLPDGYEIGASGECREILLSLWVTELLPNAKGSDAGNEFIELYNPWDVAIDLTRYELRVGVDLFRSYSFPVGDSILPGEYRTYSNAQLGYSLLNSTSRVAIAGEGEVLFEIIPYEGPEDGESWALVEGMWQYTAVPTPGSPNTLHAASIDVQTAATESSSSGLVPCAPNQYRSSETNRCRLITTSSPVPAPCKDNQYRSEETNRCRTVSVTTSPSACPEGQVRNPETNRCRKVSVLGASTYAPAAVSERAEAPSYLWVLIAIGIVAAAIYAIWEWRYEIGRFGKRVILRIRSKK